MRRETEEKGIANKRAGRGTGRETQEWQGEEKNSEKRRLGKDKPLGKVVHEITGRD